MNQAGAKQPQNGGPERPNRSGWTPYVLLAAAVVGAIAITQLSERPSATTHAAIARAVSQAPPSAPPGALRPQAGTLIHWDQGEQPGETIYAVDGLLLSLSSRPGEYNPIPVLMITGPQGESFEVIGQAGMSNAQAELGVGRIDPASPVSQVIFNTFSGGAHCCQKILLVEKLAGRWQSVEVAEGDNITIGEFPKDIDGDGKVEFQLVDNRFLYAFASYGGSWAPPQLLSVENGKVRDVSAEKRFERIYATYLAGPQEDCQTSGNNGACAAYVAAAARLGQLDEAWPVMLAAYDKTSDWALPTACRPPALSETCAEGATVTFATFPEALRWFLGDAGYAAPIYIEPTDPTGPSFSCTAVKSAVLKLVCATPELAKADRQMSVLYSRAMALSSDPKGLREDQRAFLGSRDDAPADAFVLMRLYQARLNAFSDSES